MSTTPETGDTGREPGGEVLPFPPRLPADPPADAPDGTSDTSFEVQLDDEPGTPGPVDAGEGIVLPDPDGEHYPVIPGTCAAWPGSARL